jgi:hypothetical protein
MAPTEPIARLTVQLRMHPAIASCLALLVVGSSAHAQTAGAKALAQRGAPAQGSKAAAAPRPVVTDTGLTLGSFVASRLDGKRLPVADLATDSLGTQFLIEFAELVLTLRPNGEFRASLRYRQTLATKGQRTSSEPMQRMTVFGTWFREGQSIRFVPDPARGGQGLRILAGTCTAKTITVPFDYQNGRLVRRSTALLAYDPNLF